MTNREKLEQTFAHYCGLKFGCQSGDEVMITVGVNRKNTERWDSFVLDDWLNEEYQEQRELEPCPFCGGEAVLHVNDGVRVICKNCECRTKTLYDYHSNDTYGGNAVKSVIKEWNKRAWKFN